MPIKTKNRRLGLALALVVLGISLYSFIVIRTRGRMGESAGLTKAQSILRGL